MTKIALIEDELAIVKMYQFKLELEGYEVQTAHNGRDGLKIIREFRPELILLDLKMPIMSGDELLEKIRVYDWGQYIKVIILTNISRDEAPPRLRFLNVDRYIVKAHHTPQQIIGIIEEVMNTKDHN